MDVAQIATAVGTFIGAMVAAFFSRKSKAAAEKVRSEVEGPGDEPSLRQILIEQRRAMDDHAAAVATEFARTHRDAGAIMERVGTLEARVAELETAVGG